MDDIEDNSPKSDRNLQILKFNIYITPEKFSRDPKGKAVIFQSHHFSGASC